MTILDKLASHGLIQPPRFLIPNLHYLTQMGSVAYGVSGDTSDVDIYGFCIPPKDVIFPHLAGIVPGFGSQPEQFHQWSQHHIRSPDKEVEYDFAIYGIVRYFDLLLGCNPNMIDSIFVPRRCILHSTQIGEHVRENRKLFLHKGAWHKFKGYVYSQMAKMRSKTNASNPARAASIAQHGYDLKFSYHIIRLLTEVEQIMVEHDLDLERNREQLKSIRRGEWTLDEIEDYFTMKERSLEEVYATCTLPHSPDEERIKGILLDCLEQHYGDIGTAIARNPSLDCLVDDLRSVLDRYTVRSA